LTDLFAQQNQVSVHPAKPETDTFNRFFNPEAIGAERSQSPTPEFPQFSPKPAFVPPPAADPLAQRGTFPPLNSHDAERPRNEMGTGSAVFADPTQRHDPKATRLFSFDQPTVDPGVPAGGPSAFTRIINSSAQRSATERVESPVPAVNNPLPQTPPAASVPVPVFAPQWSAPSVPAPQLYPPAIPQQPPMPMPAVAPVQWPQPPALPAVALPSAQPPQIPPAEQPPQPAWMAYLPLIIGLNVLLFLTAIIILIVAMSR
jgi:hypothetical protein